MRDASINVADLKSHGCKITIITLPEPIRSNYLVAGRISYDGMVHQSNEKQWSPEYDVRRCYDQEHFHSLHAFPLHPSQIISHFSMLLDGTRPLKYRLGFRDLVERILFVQLQHFYGVSRPFPFLSFPSTLSRPHECVCIRKRARKQIRSERERFFTTARIKLRGWQRG